MLRLWISIFLVVAVAGSQAAAEPSEVTCTFAGYTLPCTVESHVGGMPHIELSPIDKSDWEFLERDMAPDATALHAELLNHPTWETARRYALSQIYRQYRAMQAMKLATYARYKIMAQVKAKYGELDELALIEAVVIEAGMPVVNVPDLAETLTPGELLDLSRLMRPGGGKDAN
jgi:hypothetical protein